MVNRVIKAGRLLIFDPLMFCKKIYSILRSFYPLSKYPICKRMAGVTFEFDFGYDPVIKHMYCGEYEIEIVQAMKMFLHEGDTFVDIGANIGYLSFVAAGIVGRNGQVHSFEPVPQHFSKLKNMAMLNNEYSIKVAQCALGSEDGTAKIAVTNLANIGWNTIVPGFMSQNTVKEFIDVPVIRFDDYVSKNVLRNISLVKIDTEGFEFLVLKGFSRFFKSVSVKPAILCEIAPTAYSYLGYTLDQLSEYMKTYGYVAYDVSDVNAKILISNLKKTTNVVFIHGKEDYQSKSK